LAESESYRVVVAQLLTDSGMSVELIKQGKSGEATDGGLRRLAADVISLKPDYVTVMYGWNDSVVSQGRSEPRLPLSDYEANLRQIVQRLRAAGILPILMTPPPLGRKFMTWSPYKNRGPNCIIIDYVRAVRRVAGDEAVPLVDNFAAWAEASFMGADMDSFLADDGHPGPSGHQLIAETMYPVLAHLLGAPARPPATTAPPAAAASTG
jgi:lysophospholipase L1-like esterase